MTELAAWYQKKISTYDKQEWETTIENRILHGLAEVPLKSAKLRPDLIDVDLIRGSSFPKAKPVQGVALVVRLALLRMVLLPAWIGWWGTHTSVQTARLLLGLWFLQTVNIVLYVLAPSHVHIDGSSVLVPLFLTIGLGVVHAMIVSTSPLRQSCHRFRLFSGDGRRKRRRASGSQDKDFIQQKKSTDGSPSSPYEDAITNESISDFFVKETVSTPNSKRHLNSENIETEDEKLEWARFPAESPTPSPSVSFKLGGKRLVRGDPSDDDVEEECPVHRERAQRQTSANPEGDDGFESLNGNNSNGSDNGDEIFYQEDETKDGHESDDEKEKEDDKEEVQIKKETVKRNESSPTGILYESKMRKRVRSKEQDVGSECDARTPGEEGPGVRFGGIRGPSNEGRSSSEGGRMGNSFRNSWVQELLENRSSLKGKRHKTCASCPSSTSEEECDTASASIGASQHTDWVGQTTNSEECSCSSEHEESEWERRETDPAWEPCAILGPASDKVSCTIWESGRVLKAPLSAVDISRAVVWRAERSLARTNTGLWPGILLAPILAVLPTATRLLQILIDSDTQGNDNVTVWDIPYLFFMNSPLQTLGAALGSDAWERVVNLISGFLRFGLASLVFFLLAVAERAFRQRFFYAKLFSHVTSARRARQSSLPHFRLNRVRNIKTWLSVRAYLKRRGPQRSVDVIVSAAFFMMVLLISYLVVELLKEPGQAEAAKAAEAMGWVLSLGAVLLRLASLGTKAARKHHCLPVLLTEQINLHLAMERRPASKERLAVANNVLKLAADLLKELDSPFRISGLSANPYLYNITKLVVLSALSGVLSELLGFKLKLHKIKIK